MIKFFNFLKNFFSKNNTRYNNSFTNHHDELFKDNNFEIYEYQKIPLNTDCYLMDAKYMHQYEQNILRYFQDYHHGKNYKLTGFIASLGVVEIDKGSITINWFPDSISRFHGVTVNLPKKEIIKCVSSWNYDEKPHIFVRGNWLEHLHIRYHSIFGMIDAINVKNALREGKITLSQLVKLRKGIDDIAKDYKNISFISFADTIIQ